MGYDLESMICVLIVNTWWFMFLMFILDGLWFIKYDL